MISYLITHGMVSVLLFIPVLFLARNEAIPNRLRLALLYLILLKSILPWGLLRFPAPTFHEGVYGKGISYDPATAIDADTASSLSATFTHDHLILMIWGALFILGIFLGSVCLFRLAGKVRQATQCSDPVINDFMETLFTMGYGRRAIKVLISNTATPPFVWWNRQWIIVLPKSVLPLDKKMKKVILAHEFIHIQRHDFIKFLLLNTLKTLFFFSPLVLYVIREILDREETETDLKAMRSFGISPDNFGETILHMHSATGLANYPIPALFNPTKRRVKMRLEGLFQNRCTKNKWVQTSVLLVTMLLLTCNFSSAATAESDTAKGSFITPVASSRLTLGFGMKTHPFTKKPYRHQGIDLAAPMNTDVVAPAGGKVLKTGYDDSRGYFMLLQHDNGYTTFYAHLAKILVSKGGVEQGEAIAKLGNSGASTGPHLHFEYARTTLPSIP